MFHNCFFSVFFFFIYVMYNPKITIRYGTHLSKQYMIRLMRLAGYFIHS